MASPILLPAAFDGMAQDFPRNDMPKGKAWNLVDYIPQILGAPLTERGGWAFASAALTAVDAGATYVKAAIYAPFTAGAQLVVIDDNTHVIKVVSSVSSTDMGTAFPPLQNPVMHQQLVVIPSDDGSHVPTKYDGSVVASLGGSAPSGRYAAVFVNRTILAGTVAQPQRVYFSAAGDPTTWVTVGTSASFIDVGFPVKGIAALPNVLLVFGADGERTARIRGTTPPPGTDMQLDDPIFKYGVADARSIAVNGSMAVFANSIGVFLTNGTNRPEDLTKSCGVSGSWSKLMTGFNASTWTVASGWFGNIVIVSVMNGTTLIDTYAFDTDKREAFRISNLKAMCFAAAGVGGQELYAGSRVAPRVLQLSTMWTPGAAFKNDADGTPVTGVWETPFYDPKSWGLQRWRWAYLEHDLRDAASDTPTFSIAYITSPESTAYTTVTPTVGAVTQQTIVRRPIPKKATGMAFKVTRANAASFARIYGLAADLHSLEGSRRS